MKAITDVSVTITRLVSPDILKYYTLNSQRWVDIGGDINIRVKLSRIFAPRLQKRPTSASCD